MWHCFLSSCLAKSQGKTSPGKTLEYRNNQIINCGWEKMGYFFPSGSKAVIPGCSPLTGTEVPDPWKQLLTHCPGAVINKWCPERKTEALYPSTDTENLKKLPLKSHSAQWFAVILRVKGELGSSDESLPQGSSSWSSRTAPCWSLRDKGTHPHGDSHRATLNLFLHCPLPHPVPLLSQKPNLLSE